MISEKFKELEQRNGSDKIQLCYELFCEEKQAIPVNQFKQLFSIWLRMFNGGSVENAIEYFKKNKVK